MFHRKEQIEDETFIERKAREKKDLLIITGIVVGIYLFISLYLIQFVYIQETEIRSDLSTKFLHAFKNFFTRPTIAFAEMPGVLAVWGFATILVACAALVRFVIHKEKAHDDVESVNGDAKLMDKKDLAKHNLLRVDPVGSKKTDGLTNTIIAQELMLSTVGEKTKRNCNMLVIGGSGAGKSLYFVGPNILQYNTNLVITDPSGDLITKYGAALENNGYKVTVFNLMQMTKSSRYNPFEYIYEEKDVMILVDILIKNTNPDGKKATGDDAFWEKCEKLLLQAIILYIWHTMPLEKQNFKSVIELIQEADAKEDDETAKSKLDKKFDNLKEIEDTNLAVLQYDAFKKAAGKTLKSVIISVVARMEKFMLADIQGLTAYDEMDFRHFADEKRALFIIIPSEDTTFNFIASLMYSQLFLTVYNYGSATLKYNWYISTEQDIFKVFQSSSEEEATNKKIEAQNWLNDIKNNGLVVKHNVDRDRYELWGKYTKDSQVIETMITCNPDETFVNNKKIALESITEPTQRASDSVKCPFHVRFLMDEFANIAAIPEFDKKLSTMRKYNISCSIILQAISQLKAMYKDEWNTIAANCDTKLFLGCDDNETIKWLVEQLGKKTTRVMNESYSSGKQGGGNTSLNRSSRDLMTYEEIAGMADNKCIAKIRGENPYFGRKYNLFNHPNYEYSHKHNGEYVFPTIKTEMDTHVPLRLRKPYVNKKDEPDNASDEPPRNPQPDVQGTDGSDVPPYPDENPQPDAFDESVAKVLGQRAAQTNNGNRKHNKAVQKAKQDNSDNNIKNLNKGVENAKKEIAATTSCQSEDDFVDKLQYTYFTPIYPNGDISYNKM